MVNDTIVNAKNFSDRLCNEVILFSNDFARDLGVSYGELWAGITIFVIFMIVYYKRYIVALIVLSQAKENHQVHLLDYTRAYCLVSRVHLSNDECCCKS